ncbi:MAG: carbamoyl-phosphate synthase, large subunit [candidate division NC10 bacterium]|nr:carbamoyl-phosphate synthase, large subunit [candidate division NC10 bacterium]
MERVVPNRTDIETILILGSGPIVIGQACEFDYSGTQACRVLKSLGYRIVLVNSNPATIMTDPELADRTYIEPLTPDLVAQIIEREKPQALLPTMGGQTSLNLAYALHESGVLAAHGVELIGARFEAIQKAESRELFAASMRRVGLEVPRGRIVRTVEEALALMDEIAFPVILRPAFTLGGTGGGTAYRQAEYKAKIARALALSPVHEVLVEESVIGWKEYELEVMRDRRDNFVVVCSIENLDPMGVHTGDSITVAPAQTLTDKEYQRMRDAARLVMTEIGVETGGSNVQFAVNPADGRLVVIEMNPRVSRSSALASKATGFPIAKIAAMLAVGLTLDEIPNDITRKTPACFEPSIDYVVTKVPRWDFEKFSGSSDELGVQMKSVGEVMAIGRNFPESLQKAFRSLEIGHFGLGADGRDVLNVHGPKADAAAMKKAIRKRLERPHPNNLLFVKYGLQLGMSVRELSRRTGIDPWFIHEVERIAEMETSLRGRPLASLDREDLWEAKRLGFSDRQIGFLCGGTEEKARRRRERLKLEAVFKTVDTCAAEFAAATPYYYSTYEEENEARPSSRRKVIILGGGPNRIGQGIEFDYCCVHGVFALKEEGFEVQMINCNPETVSTDYDITDRLFFEPLTLEDVMRIVHNEKPYGVIVQFGGQTPLKLALPLERAGVRILGTSPDSIDLAEDRKRFGALLRRMKIPHPPYGTAGSAPEALAVARQIGYPVLVRPSYVLGGRAMRIVYDDHMLRQYMRDAVSASPEHPVLIDKFLEDAFEFDVDAVYDGRDLLMGGIMQHIEEAGIHSGDSACVLPPYMITHEQLEQIELYTRRLASALKVKGLLNVQYAMRDGGVYVLEVNPRASRTVPFVSKAVGLPLAKVAARVMVGRSLKKMGLTRPPLPRHVSVKEAVLPFNKFSDVSIYLGPEMRSTGEVMGISYSFGNAFAKSQVAAGGGLPTSGTVFISVNDNDKFRMIPIARDFVELGFDLVATEGTCRSLRACGIACGLVHKVGKGEPTSLSLIRQGKIHLIVNTPWGKVSRTHEYEIGRVAMAHNVPCITTLSGASAAVRGIMSVKNKTLAVCSLQEYHA